VDLQVVVRHATKEAVVFGVNMMMIMEFVYQQRDQKDVAKEI